MQSDAYRYLIEFADNLVDYFEKGIYKDFSLYGNFLFKELKGKIQTYKNQKMSDEVPVDKCRNALSFIEEVLCDLLTSSLITSPILLIEVGGVATGVVPGLMQYNEGYARQNGWRRRIRSPDNGFDYLGHYAQLDQLEIIIHAFYKKMADEFPKLEQSFNDGNVIVTGENEAKILDDAEKSPENLSQEPAPQLIEDKMIYDWIKDHKILEIVKKREESLVVTSLPPQAYVADNNNNLMMMCTMLGMCFGFGLGGIISANTAKYNKKELIFDEEGVQIGSSVVPNEAGWMLIGTLSVTFLFVGALIASHKQIIEKARSMLSFAYSNIGDSRHGATNHPVDNIMNMS